MNKKLTIIVLFVVALVGCDVNKDSYYVGPWQQTGPVTVISASLYNIAFEDSNHLVTTLRLCAGEANWSIKNEQIIDIKFRKVNRYHYSDDLCDEFDTYKIIKP